MTIRKKTSFDLDKEEQSLSDSFDKGEWKSLKNVKREIKKARNAAGNYLRKTARINIRISQNDLEHIKRCL